MSAETRHRPPVPLPLLAVCFFGSGLTGLIYEVIWFRRLQYSFGCTTHAVTTVLAAFMAGLGLGAYLIGRRVDRARAGGVRIYAYLELGVGLFALLSLPLLGLAERLYVALQSWLALGPAGATLLKLCLAFPVLALPAGLMGGTLPALTRGLLRRREGLHSLVGWLYGVNTAGAAIGTALGGMLMIELLGLQRSVAAAAAVNLGIGLLVLLWLRRAPAPEPPAGAQQPAPDGAQLRRHLRSRPVRFCLVAVAASGALSMLYEVVWTRMLALVVGSSTYAFSMVLAVFLVGLSLGALAYGRLGRGRPPRVRDLVWLLLGLAAWAAATLALVPRLPLLLLLLQLPDVGFWGVLAFQSLLALCLLLVPTLLLGAALPLAIGIIGRRLGQAGEDVGGAYLINTLGAIAGALLAGFLLVPRLGSQNTLLAGLLIR